MTKRNTSDTVTVSLRGTKNQVVDLSVGVKTGMPHYPSPYLPETVIVPSATHDVQKRAASTITFGSHAGTHADAPWHMFPEGATLDQIPLSQWIGPARVLRLPDRMYTTPITGADIQAANIPHNIEKLIIHTGWCESHWGMIEYWLEGPHLTSCAVDALLGFPQLHLLGIDVPNIDAAVDTRMGVSAPRHYSLLSRGMVIVETLYNLSKIPDELFLITAPLRLAGGDGCPCRPLALFQVGSA